MGTEYSAKIVVGLPVEEMRELQDEDGYWDEDGELEFVPDSYDSPSGVVGIVIANSGDYSYLEIDTEVIVPKIYDAEDKFMQLTNKQAKVFLCTNGH